MSSPHVTVVNELDFAREVINADKLVLIDFYADWCGPCQALAPTLEKFAAANQNTVKVVKINVDQNPDLAARFGIRSIPTLVTVKNGQAIFGTTGNVAQQALEHLVNSSIQKLGGRPPVPKGPWQ